MTDTNATANAVDENAANGTPVGITAAASDADATTNTITYSLDDNAGGRFAIDANTGVVTVANGSAARPRDGRRRTTSRCGPPRPTARPPTQTFTINVTDVNEFDVGAVSDTNAAANAVDENATNGTTVGITAAASDADATTNTITYTLQDNAGGRFAIDANTGVVTVAGAHRSRSGRRQSQHHGPRHFGRRLVHRPDASRSPSTTSTSSTSARSATPNAAANAVDENATNGTAVGITASASDADATNNTITYTLQDNAGGRFAIDANTGVVTVAGGDRPRSGRRQPQHHGPGHVQPTARSPTSAFTITITDVNEFDVGAVTDTDARGQRGERERGHWHDGRHHGRGQRRGRHHQHDQLLAGGQRRRTVCHRCHHGRGDGGRRDRPRSGRRSHNITVRATSADGSFTDQTFTITINDVDEFDVGAVTDTNARGQHGG